ncbi:MAG: DUF4012 domain-containing protein [Patescibacteria group bacterium]
MSHDPHYLEHHKHYWWRSAPWIFLAVVVIIGIYVIIAAVGAGRVLAASLDARDAIYRAEAAAGDLDFIAAKTELAKAETAITHAKQGLTVLAPLRIIPYIGDQVRGVASVLDASGRLVPALREVMSVAEEIVSVVNRARELSDIPADETLTYLTMPASLRHDILVKLHQSLPELQIVRARLDLAEQDLAELDELTLAGPIQEAVKPFREALPVVKESVDFLVPIAELIPAYAGLTSPARQLVLFENNTELRPGGGFIGTVGDLQISDGAIVSLSTRDVYDVDGPAVGKITTEPPAALKTYTGVEAWYLRDANWSPDFSVSAQTALDFFAAEQIAAGVAPTAYDGAIAITPSFAADLLKVVGDVTIDGQTFTPDNVAELLDYQVEFGYVESGTPRAQRKEVIGKLTQEVVARLMALPLASWPRVIDATEHNLTQKQLLFYSADADTQKSLEEIGWAGRITPPEGDSLLVVDANLASLKTDPAVQHSIEHVVRRNEQGRLVATTTITYNHTGTFDQLTTRYRTYTRVYVPKGSELIRSSGALQNDKLLDPSQKPGTVDVSEDLGFTVFGAFIAVEPGATGTLQFSYYLPSMDLYDLTIFKQPGAANHDLTLDVDFGKPVKSATPGEDPKDYGNTQYLLNTKLTQDLEFSVRY